MDVSFTKDYIESTAKQSLQALGYDCTVKVESQDIIAVTVFSRNGVELDGQHRKFRFCKFREDTISSSGRHRSNYYEWREGLVKFSSANFWLTRSKIKRLRGSYTDAELAYNRQYNISHVEEKRQRYAAYNIAHAEERLAYNTNRLSQLWTNGTETLKWSTLHNRGRKSDLIAQGWHPV